MLKEKIQEDIKEALRKKDKLRVSVLRMLISSVLNKEKEKRAKLAKTEKDEEKLTQLSKLTDEETLQAVSSEVKKRNDSIEQYEKGNRPDLAEQEKKELEILKEYLPEQMSEDDIRKLVKEKISELGASSSSEAGKIMGSLMPQIRGRADGTIVGKIVQEELKG